MKDMVMIFLLVKIVLLNLPHLVNDRLLNTNMWKYYHITVSILFITAFK